MPASSVAFCRPRSSHELLTGNVAAASWQKTAWTPTATQAAYPAAAALVAAILLLLFFHPPKDLDESKVKAGH